MPRKNNRKSDAQMIAERQPRGIVPQDIESYPVEPGAASVRQTERGHYGSSGHQMFPEMLAGVRGSEAEVNGWRPLTRWELEAGG